MIYQLIKSNDNRWITDNKDVKVTLQHRKEMRSYLGMYTSHKYISNLSYIVPFKFLLDHTECKIM
jgi:hypothetical protein